MIFFQKVRIGTNYFFEKIISKKKKKKTLKHFFASFGEVEKNINILFWGVATPPLLVCSESAWHSTKK